MKLKRLTLFAFVLMSAIAFSISGCTKDDDGGGGGGDGDDDPNAPVVTLKSSFPGDINWVWENKVWPAGTKVRFGIEVKCPTEIEKVEVIRKTIAGPQNGTSIQIWDTTLNELIINKTQIKELLVDGVVATQTVVFTFRATAKNGKVGETSIQITSDNSVGERNSESLFDREENGAYDLTQAVSLSRSNATGRHDIKLSKVGSDFKLVSGNNSKFKAYKGTTTFLGFTEKSRLDLAWSQSGAEQSESPILTETLDPDIYNYILVKSSQNNQVYVIDVYEIKSDEIVFDYRGEGI